MSTETIARYRLQGMGERFAPVTVTERTDAATGWKPTRYYHVAVGTHRRVFKTMRGALIWGRAALKDSTAQLEHVGNDPERNSVRGRWV